MADVLYLDPKSVHVPGALYSHSALVPADKKTLYIAGQVGLRLDGTFGATLPEQAEQVFRNIKAILEAHGLGFGDIVKMNTFVVAGQNGIEVRPVRQAHMGDHKPVQTFVYVPQLMRPEWLIEVEAIAVAP
jgi:enamine deaminase RidA (YjgF/YER057c/UK114 family)